MSQELLIIIGLMCGIVGFLIAYVLDKKNIHPPYL